MISTRLLGTVLTAFLIVCFISAPVLCGDGDEDPWDVDDTNPGGYQLPGGDGDSTELELEYEGPGDPNGGGDPFQSIVLRYGYGAWVMMFSWTEQNPVSNQAVAGKADGGTAAIR